MTLNDGLYPCNLGMGFFVECRSHLFAICKWVELLTPGQRLETCSIPLRFSKLTPTLEDVTLILGVRSEGEPFLSIPPRMSTSYASDCKELLGIPFEEIRGRHDSKIHLGKLRWEFTGVPHRLERMIGGHAPVSVGRRPSHREKAPVEEDDARGESSHPSTGGAARSSRDAEGVGRDTPYLGDESAFFDEDTVPPLVLLTDEEWREQERERIRDAHELAMIEDELEVFRQEVDLTIDHGPLSDSEIHSMWAVLVCLFREFLFVGRFKGLAHLSVVWATRQLDYLERVAWGPVIVGLCGQRSPLLGGLFNLPPSLGMGAHHHSSPSLRSTGAIIPDDSLLVIWRVGF
ncbi:hypothetical protein AMTR_s00015p00058540 [Amborella trichopoda]|uniref:Aminotransferase-like plant mobile domain-containing protein n=1 Tax=Amborella trichopoda TaxID=13333 RepID=W1PLC6_AMBTC|nr:hypothetical protein AMTR_s00015p00058540 [Amborella trichopoda]